VTTMTKAELVDEVAKVSNLTQKETELIVNTIFDGITDALRKGEKVELRGFGSFRVRRRNPRRGRNPKTGIGVDVPGKRVPFFKVVKAIRELVNRPRPDQAASRTAPQSAGAGQRV
jgi:integration host factor subunit beta